MHFKERGFGTAEREDQRKALKVGRGGEFE